jgi:MoaA/NifB/PqqE/SkfB family radical SAM enzyme
MSKTFCPIPWNFQAVQNNGTIRVCCQMNMTESRGTLKKEDGSVYNAGVDDLEEARNAKLIKSVRQEMLLGNWPTECSRCKQEEDSGLRSRRQYENEYWKLKPDDVSPITDETGKISTKDSPVVYYDLRFGNVCNLACRMCGPEDSHTWYKDWAQMYGSEWNDTHGKVVLEKNAQGRWVTDAYNWHYSESFWKQIEENINSIQHVYMAGGEPLIIDRHYEFLNKCVDRGISKNIILEYNTNLTSLPKKATELWNKFKLVRVGASIDGFGDVLEYQRYPANWRQIEKNIKQLDLLPDNVEAWLACTVTNINIFQIPDFMLWKLKQNFKKINMKNNDSIITPHVCHKPWYSSIRVLPPDIKQLIKEYYELQKEQFVVYDQITQKRAFKIMDGIINYMMSSDESDKLNLFVDYTNKLDKIRNQSITKIIPQYTKVFNNDYYK